MLCPNCMTGCLPRLQLQTNDWKTLCRREARWPRSVKTFKKEDSKVLLQESRWWIFCFQSFCVAVHVHLAPASRLLNTSWPALCFSWPHYHWVARPGFWTKWRWWSAQRRPGATSTTCWRRERCWLRKSTTSSSRWRLEIDQLPRLGWAVGLHQWRQEPSYLRKELKTSGSHMMTHFFFSLSPCSVARSSYLSWRATRRWKRLLANRWRTWRRRWASGESDQEAELLPQRKGWKYRIVFMGTPRV